ncbi:MAG: hypothetical protein MZV70_09610 [Desulfobacterales bacterium]|nr:hypothetical protein [Desulfobacterales bacterium]
MSRKEAVADHIGRIDRPTGVIKGIKAVSIVAENHVGGIIGGGNGKPVKLDGCRKFFWVVPGRRLSNSTDNFPRYIVAYRL